MNETHLKFFEHWWDAMRTLPKKERQRLIFAILEFSFDGKEPEFEKGSPCHVVWPIIRDQIEVKQKKSYRQATREPISTKTRFMVLERDGFTCQYCGAKPPDAKLQVDHIIPVSKGGTNDPENLVTACFECNSGKRAHVIGEPRKWSK